MTSPRSELRRRRHLSELGVVLLAVAAWSGALHPQSRPVVALGVVGVSTLVWRRPVALVVVVGLLAQGMAERAEAGMRVGVGTEVGDTLTLLTDPKPDPLGRQWRAEARHDGRRWQLDVPAEVATGAFEQALAGERVEVFGRTRRLAPGADWLRQRHVVGAIRVDRVGAVSPGTLTHRFANGIRRRLVAGAVPLGSRRQALFAGFVLGDDRFQDPVDGASFQRAGLTHLLAVSGQNVAFVLALAAPLLLRLRLGWRLAATLALIALFALLTRFEPSVLRASVMAAMAAAAVSWGRNAPSTRVLALTVTCLVLVDPFLVHSVGFRLSVGASGGILLLSGPFARRIPGPRPFVLALSVTAAAQLGVAPMLLATFGPMPLASLPANLLAGPASGPVMMWGMSAGLLAGFVPAIAALVHVPTGALLGWIEWVARAVPSAMPGQLDASALAMLVAALAAAAWVGRRWWPVGLVLAAVTVALVSDASSPAATRLWNESVSSGVTVWVGPDGGSVVVVDGRANPERSLLALSDAGIDRVDLVIVRTDAAGSVRTGAAIAVDRSVPSVVRRQDLAPGVSEGRFGCLDVRIDAGDMGVSVDVADEPRCLPG